MPKVTNMFPLSIYQDRLEIDADYRSRLIDEIIEMGNHDANKKLGFSWTGDVHAIDCIHREELFQKLFQGFSKTLLGYVENLGISPQKIDLYYTRSWATISRENESIAPHAHVQSHISLVYYLKKPANTGGIIFSHDSPPNEFSPSLFHIQMLKSGVLTKDSPLNCKSVLIDPIEGDIIVFPSKTRHGTQDNQTQDLRISISSDIVVTLREAQNVEFLMPNVDQWQRIT
ncbi:MAG: putative 2OG-Fe(II) oxygenase [Planctomycetota bacterium]|jgi:uncharacterized protein (TIGR02466 family)